MTDLSPAAQAVLNAVTLNRYDVPYYACPKSIDQIKSDVAAALRAAADQVVPPLDIKPQEDLESRREAMEWGMNSQTQLTRHQLLAIADELEAL
jgi:hypothetical protein